MYLILALTARGGATGGCCALHYAMVAHAHGSHDRFVSTISNPVAIVFSDDDDVHACHAIP